MSLPHLVGRRRRPRPAPSRSGAFADGRRLSFGCDANRHLRPGRVAAGVLLGVALTLGVAGPASAGTGAAPPGAPIAPVASCSSLVARDFSGVRDAPGKVTSSAVVNVALSTKTVPFCDVKGHFAPHTNFELELPTATWHGQYL